MRFHTPFFRVLACLLSGLGLIPAASAAQANYAPGVQQVLDRVYAYTPTAVLDVQPADADWSVDTSNLGITAAALSVCALTPVSGLYCLDGTQLRNWPNPADPGTSYKVLDCVATLGLDAKAGGCTGLSVAQSGTIWLAGKKKNTHSVLKVTKGAGSCPGGVSFNANGAAYCAVEQYTGRPVLVDISVVDGDTAARFPLGGGVLGVEERKDTVFFPDPKTTPVVIATSRDWGLSGGELLQDVALLQVPQTGGAASSYVLATTSNGRVLARSIAGSAASPVLGAVRSVYNIPNSRTGSQCNSDAQQYGLRASSTASVVYISDRNYCQILALQPDSAAFAMLLHVQRENGSDLVLSTDAGAGFIYPTIGLTVAPGISFLLTDCTAHCDVVGDGNDNNTAAAQFIGVTLVPGTPDGAVAFQVKGIPDCRYASEAVFSPEQVTACGLPGVVLDGPASCGGASCPAAAKSLNVTPLLPNDVIQAFKGSGIGNGVLPPLLISPQYRAQAGNGHVFEAFFVITSPQVRFRDTFQMEYDVADLQGTAGSLGCEPASSALPDLLKWDIGTTVSEMYKSVNGDNIDTLRNIGCGSIRDMGERLSLLPYNLELTPDTYAPTLNSTTPLLTTNNDAVFARLMQKLYGDLHLIELNYACKKGADGQPGSVAAPLAASVCSSLKSSWDTGLVKLNNCINAGFQPKQSAGDENCKAFVSQLTNYRARIPATTSAADIANRTGELKARVEVLFHLYYTRYLPSIPANGFCREAGTCQ